MVDHTGPKLGSQQKMLRQQSTVQEPSHGRMQNRACPVTARRMHLLTGKRACSVRESVCSGLFCLMLLISWLHGQGRGATVTAGA
jgi:hypothetical protein